MQHSHFYASRISIFQKPFLLIAQGESPCGALHLPLKVLDRLPWHLHWSQPGHRRHQADWCCEFLTPAELILLVAPVLDVHFFFFLVQLDNKAMVGIHVLQLGQISVGNLRKIFDETENYFVYDLLTSGALPWC